MKKIAKQKMREVNHHGQMHPSILRGKMPKEKCEKKMKQEKCKRQANASYK